MKSVVFECDAKGHLQALVAFGKRGKNADGNLQAFSQNVQGCTVPMLKGDDNGQDGGSNYMIARKQMKPLVHAIMRAFESR